MKKITVEYCGIEASGTTVREAKQAAATRLSRLVKDVEQAPTIVRSGAYAKLVWRGIEGWRSTIIAAPDMTHGTMAHLYGSCMSGDDRTTAVRRALCDVVQLAWNLDVGSIPVSQPRMVCAAMISPVFSAGPLGNGHTLRPLPILLPMA